MSESKLTKKDVVVEEIRRRIDSGELRRGDWVRQDVLADALETSITPVREAMRELQAEGLLVGHPHRGVQVATIDLEQVKGVYMTRRLVEPYAMQRAAFAVSRRDLDRARQLNRAIAATDDGLEASELNREFHFVFYDKSGPESFIAIIRDLWEQFPWDILRLRSERVVDSIGEHEAMIDAVEANDGEAIRQTTQTHILHGYRDLATYLNAESEAAGGDRASVDDPFDL